MTIISKLINDRLSDYSSSYEDFVKLVSLLESNQKYDEARLAAWLMSIRCLGLSKSETADLTKAMASEIKDFEGLNVVDKHSTGGVGDSVSLIALPIVAANGIPIVKLSGKMLGFTGGTVDKLMSIPNINLSKNKKEIINQVKETSLYIGAQTEELCKSDKIMYDLRHRTHSVDSIPLIASSIMSKKIVAGSKNIVINLKYGNGAFMSDLNKAIHLKEYMESIARAHHINLAVILEESNQPLSQKIGTRIEIRNAYDILQKGYTQSILQKETKRLTMMSIEIASHMISLALNLEFAFAKEKAVEALNNGKACQTFEKMIVAQGGDLQAVFSQKAKYEYKLVSDYPGKIQQIHTKELGSLINRYSVNASREIDYEFAVVLHKELGDAVAKNDPLFTVYSNQRYREDEIMSLEQELKKTYLIN